MYVRHAQKIAKLFFSVRSTQFPFKLNILFKKTYINLLGPKTLRICIYACMYLNITITALQYFSHFFFDVLTYFLISVNASYSIALSGAFHPVAMFTGLALKVVGALISKIQKHDSFLVIPRIELRIEIISRLSFRPQLFTKNLSNKCYYYCNQCARNFVGMRHVGKPLRTTTVKYDLFSTRLL